MANVRLTVIFLLTTLLLPGCFIVRKIAGADVDPVQYLIAREAVITKLKFKATSELTKRLTNGNPIDDADILIYLSEKLINNLAAQYIGTSGWLDESTSFSIDSVNVIIENGVAVASLAGIADNHEYGVGAAIALDCLLNINREKDDLLLTLEPFNITPVVRAGFLLSPAEDIIKDLLLVNLGELSKQFPGIKIPLDFHNKIFVDESKVRVKDKINLSIVNPERIVYYKMNLKEILFFKGKVFISLDLKDVNIY